MKIIIELGKYRKTKTLIKNTLLCDFKNGIRLIIPNNYLKSQYLICRKKLIFCLRVCRHKTAQFKGYFLGAWAVLDILFKFTPGMESGRKNEGFILDLLVQFKRDLFPSPSKRHIIYAVKTSINPNFFYYSSVCI